MWADGRECVGPKPILADQPTVPRPASDSDSNVYTLYASRQEHVVRVGRYGSKVRDPQTDVTVEVGGVVAWVEGFGSRLVMFVHGGDKAPYHRLWGRA